MGEPDLPLRAIFEGTHDGMLVLDEEGRYLHANPAATALFGVPHSELIGRSAWSFALEGFDAEVVRAALRRDGRAAGDLAIRRPDGTLRHVTFRITADVQPGRHLSVLHDVTARKEAERARADSERRFRFLVEASTDVVCITSAGKIVYASPAITGVLGYEPREVVGHDALHLYHPDDRVAAMTARAALAGSERQGTVHLKARLLHKNGEFRRVELRARDYSDESTIGGSVVNFHDITERENALDELRRSEATLRVSQTRLEKAQSVGHIGSWTLDTSMPKGFFEVSDETLSIYRMPRAEFDSDPMSLHERMHPEDRARAQEAFVRGVAAGEGFAYDARILRPNGLAWIHVDAVVEVDADGCARRVLGTTLDITARKRAEEELRASEARYRRIIETTSEGVWLMSPDRRTTFVNRPLAEMFGYAPEEMVGRPATDLLAEGLPVGFEQGAATLRSGASVRLDFHFLRKDGSTFWATVAVTPMFDEAGRFEGTLSMVADVTARRQADALRARFAAIVEFSDDAIVSMSLDGTVLTWNRGAERLYGYAAEEIIGRSTTILSIPGRDEVSAMLERIRSGSHVERVDTVRRRKDSSLVEVSLTLSAMRASDGSIIGVSAIARDVTERRRADRAERSLRETEEQLRQAQKLEALGQLAGGVAHDFNNILSVILGYTSIMIDELPARDPIREDVTQIHEAGVRASELTRQLLAFSRKAVLQPRVVEVEAVVKEAERILRRVLGEDIELQILESTEPTSAMADPGQLEQVILNLAVNARDAMPSGGRLLIETGRTSVSAVTAADMGIAPGAYVVLTVADNGVGMDEALLSRIFEPFFTTKEKGKGTGLGLSTVFGIIKQSAGHVKVTSTPGQGSIFRVLLPATELPADPQRSSSGVPATANARAAETILLVEDEVQVRTLARTILRRAGYHVLEASNAGEAILVSEQHEGKIDLLLTDVVMPRMGGHPLAVRLREQRPEMKVLFMSGYTDDTVLRHGVELGHLEFLPKPFTPSALTAKVRAVLEVEAATVLR